MIRVGEDVQARGALLEHEEGGHCLVFQHESAWPMGVAVPPGFPAVHLVPGDPALDLHELEGHHVQVWGRWEAEGKISADRAIPLQHTSGDPGAHVAKAGEWPRSVRSEQMAAAEGRLFESGDLLWRTLSRRSGCDGVVIMQRGGSGQRIDELLGIYALEHAGLPIKVHESRWTSQELEDAQAALRDVPDHLTHSFGAGLNEDRSDVRICVDLLYPTAEVEAALSGRPEGGVQVNYLVQPCSPQPGYPYGSPRRPAEQH